MPRSLRTPPREDVKTEPLSSDEEEYMDPRLRILQDFNRNRTDSDSVAFGAGPSHAFPGPPPIYAMRSLMKRQAEAIEEAMRWKEWNTKRARLEKEAKKEEEESGDDWDVPLGQLYPDIPADPNDDKMLDSSSDEEYGEPGPMISPASSTADPLDIKQEPADDIMSIGDSPPSSPSRSDLSVQGNDGYPYHDYLTEMKNEPLDDNPHPNACEVLGIHPRPDMTWDEKKAMYDKLEEIKKMGPVYNPWLSTYQRHVRWSEHNLLVEQVQEQLKFKPLFKSTEAGRQRCREYTAIVDKIYEKEKATGAPIPDLSLANDSDDEMAPSSSSRITRSSRKRTCSGTVKTEPIDEDEQYFTKFRSTASDTRPEYSHFLPGQSSNIVLPGPPVPVMLPDGYAPRFEETRREHAPEQAPTTVKLYECTICNLRLKSLSMLNIHIQKHSKKCLKCGLKFNRFDELQKHGPYCMRANGVIVIPPRPKVVKLEPPPKPKKWHICRLCEEKFDHPRRLYWHQVKRCKKRYVSKSWVVKI